LGTRKRLIGINGGENLTSDLRVAQTSVYTDLPPNIDDYHVDWGPLTENLIGDQVTESENHPEWNRRHKSKHFHDIGGNFSSVKRFATLTLPRNMMQVYTPTDSQGTRRMARYIGPLWPTSPSNCKWPDAHLPTTASMVQDGTTAIARCSPVNPVASLSELLGETIKEGLPRLIGSGLRGFRDMTAKERRKALAGEHLNKEFGIDPFISDIRKLSEAVTRADAIWAQYERDSGKMVRRRYEFPKFESFAQEELGLMGPNWNPSTSLLYKTENYKLDGMVLRTDRVSQRKWFSGGFTYYVPREDREALAYNVIQAKKLLGLSLTPDVVWNLTPWSWLTDWFANTGDVLQNWSNWAIDGQVLQYGYMMVHTIVTRTYTYSGDTRIKGDPVPGVVTLTIDSKKRIGAGPYGFGISPNALGGHQLGILTALGITKKK